MSSPRAFAVTARLALATSVLMFGLIVLGSVVRTTGSGLACPDWPLCNGQLIPPMQFNVLIEWFHRLVALLVSLLLLATTLWILTHREVRARLGGLVGLAVLLLFAQVLLGALTVWKLLSPAVVSAHLGVALLLFTTLLTIALTARARYEDSGPGDGGVARDDKTGRGGAVGSGNTPVSRPGGAPLFATAAVLTFVQAMLGGLVSTQGAGLACPDFPTCNGQWFPAMRDGVALQMMHRFGAYALLAVMIVVLVRTRTHADPVIRSGGAMLFGMTVTQALFGAFNVALGLPVWLSAVHLGMATAILALSVTLTYLSGSRALGGWQAAEVPA